MEVTLSLTLETSNNGEMLSREIRLDSKVDLRKGERKVVIIELIFHKLSLPYILLGFIESTNHFLTNSITLILYE